MKRSLSALLASALVAWGLSRPGPSEAANAAKPSSTPSQKPGHKARKTPPPAKKKKKKARGRPPSFPTDAGDSKGSGFARLRTVECLEELERRDIPYRKAGPSPGVMTPVRLAGKVGGVTYRTDYPDSKRGTVPYEVFDCRLVVALSELSPILRQHEIEEVRLFSAWRPPPKTWPVGKITDRHPGAMAADLRLFTKSSGEALDVEKDFHGRIGAVPCGPAAVPPSPATPQALELRAILCEAADARLFHVLLSPNANPEHRNHFHVEVRPEVRWFILE